MIIYGAFKPIGLRARTDGADTGEWYDAGFPIDAGRMNFV